MKNNGGAAFPRPASEDTASGTLSGGNNAIKSQDGMSLRDWFAGMALQGIIMNENDAEDVVLSNVGTGKAIAIVSYQIADAMLAERDKL